MKKQTILCALLLSFFCATSVRATTYFNPQQVGSSAESIRIGNIQGFTNKSYALFDNPASLHRLNKFSVSLFDTTFMNEVNYRNYSTAFRLKNGVLAVGMMSASVSGIPRTAISFSGNPSVTDPFQQVQLPEGEIVRDGQYSYVNELYKVGYQFSQSRKFHWGIAVSQFRTKAGEFSGEGNNMDVGMLVVGSGTEFSLSAKNIISSMKISYNTGGSEELPMQLVAGLKVGRELMDYYVQGKLHTDSSAFTKDAAINFHPKILSGLNLSVGYKEWVVGQYIETGYKNTIQSNITFGVGLALSGLYFDYAYEHSDHVEYNGKHYFSVGFSF